MRARGWLVLLSFLLGPSIIKELDGPPPVFLGTAQGCCLGVWRTLRTTPKGEADVVGLIQRHRKVGARPWPPWIGSTHPFTNPGSPILSSTHESSTQAGRGQQASSHPGGALDDASSRLLIGALALMVERPRMRHAFRFVVVEARARRARGARWRQHPRFVYGSAEAGGRAEKASARLTPTQLTHRIAIHPHHMHAEHQHQQQPWRTRRRRRRARR